jgi:hypothetical protein
MYIHGNVATEGPAYTAATMDDVSDNRTPLRPVRVEGALWNLFGEVVGTRKRSGVIREFIRWYLREPGATMPDRPSAADLAAARSRQRSSDS